MARYVPLTRRDLRGFDDHQRDLVLAAVDQGALGRISSNGHVILRAPDGEGTTSVAPKAKRSNRGGKNQSAAMRRILAPSDPVMPETKKRETASMAQIGSSAKLACEECGQEFESMRQLSGHKLGAHSFKDGPCTCPECGVTFDSERGMNIHAAQVHKRTEMSATDAQGNSVIWVCDVCDKGYPTRRNMNQHRASAHRDRPKLSESQVLDRRKRVPIAKGSAPAPVTQAAAPQAGAAPQAPAKAPRSPQARPDAPQARPAAATPPEAPQDAGAAILARLESQAVEMAQLRQERDDARTAVALAREALREALSLLE